jgi:hypothetical protein
MFDEHVGGQHDLHRAVEESDAAQQDIADLRHDLKFVNAELAFLKTFSRKLLTVLELKLSLNLPELDEALRGAEQDREKQIEKMEHHVAPLCNSCGRPLQDEKASCMYCGVPVA